MKLDLSVSRKVRIEMLPLIDIVFLLLVFFIYAMLSMAVHRGLPVELPVSAAAEIDSKESLSVTLKADGTVFVDQERTELEDLTVLLRAQAERKGTENVLLFADRSVSYDKLFDVLDRIRLSGLGRVSLQAEAEQ